MCLYRMNYIVYHTEIFRKLYSTLDHSEQLWIEKIQRNLEVFPTGKLLYFPWFREKRYRNKRLYFLIEYTHKKILFVAFASKKDQQKTIDYIKGHMEELLSYLRSL